MSASWLEFYNIFNHCGLPQATDAEIASWNVLTTGSTGTAEISVGLWSYDITCAYTVCSLINNQDNADTNGNSGSYCTFMIANGGDGLALGAYFYVEDHGDY